MTKYQKKLYKHYLENFARAGQIGHDGKLEGGKKGGLFYDVQYLSRIWNHPFILTMAQSLADEKKYFEDNGGEDDNMRVSRLILKKKHCNEGFVKLRNALWENRSEFLSLH